MGDLLLASGRFHPGLSQRNDRICEEERVFQKTQYQLSRWSIDSIHWRIAWVNTVDDKTTPLYEFPVIADLDMNVAKLCGMLQPGEGKTVTVRAMFIIDPTGKSARWWITRLMQAVIWEK